MATRTVSVAEGRQNLPSLLQRARSGQDVTITKHGEPVAVLISPEKYRLLDAEEESLEGLVTRLRDEWNVDEIGFPGVFFETPNRASDSGLELEWD